MKTKNNKMIESIVLIISFLAIISMNVSAIPLPHGIDGIIYELDGITEVPAGIEFSINDTTTGEIITGKTGYGSPGRYSVSLNGNDGDLIVIKARSRYNSNKINITLQGVMHNVNLLLNTSEPEFAPEIISEPITKARLGKIYTYDVDAVDPNGDNLIYYLTIFP